MIATAENLNEVSGIYGVIHRDSGRVYVGQAVNMMSRRKSHRCHAKHGGRGGKFYNALRKYGEDAFDFEVLECCEPEKLCEREKFYITFLDAVNNGFNLAAEPSRSRFGVPFTPEQKLRVSESLRGKKRKPFSAEHCSKISERQSARMTPEMRQRLSLKIKGCKHTSEARAKISASQRKPILQFTQNGNFVMEYDSMQSAAKTFGVRGNSIGAAARGNLPHAYGFIWKYKNNTMKENK